jgi:hypothetical protein
MNVLDSENALTCWNSEGNPRGKTSSFLVVDFDRTVEPVELKLQFQAGFVAEELTIFKSTSPASTDSKEERWSKVDDYEVEDDHEVQSFFLNNNSKTSTKQATTALKLVFDQCTDFYGRITIYQLQVWGNELGGETKE